MTRLDRQQLVAEAVVRRLDSLLALPRECAEALEDAVRDWIREAGAREDLISQGEHPESLRMILSGWAIRYKMLEDGRRQIVALLFPGDTCDFNMTYLREMDHSVGTLTPLVYADVPRRHVEKLVGEHPLLSRAFLHETLADASIQREWALNLGARVAFERIAHLCCEIFARCQSVGLCEGDTCPFPMTQTDLADMTGMTPVHANRTLQELRASNLIEVDRRVLTVKDWDALQTVAFFEPGYLHLREGASNF